MQITTTIKIPRNDRRRILRNLEELIKGDYQAAEEKVTSSLQSTEHGEQSPASSQHFSLTAPRTMWNRLHLPRLQNAERVPEWFRATCVRLLKLRGASKDRFRGQVVWRLLFSPARKRYLICLHEAGHAVMAAMGGIRVTKVAVFFGGIEASLGRKSPVSDVLGQCTCSDPVTSRYIKYVENSPVPDRERFESDLKQRRLQSEKALAENDRKIRAHVCTFFAGSLAEFKDAFESESCEDDFLRGLSLGELLDSTGAETARLWMLVQHTFHRKPEVWAAVERLANALDKAGELKGRRLQELLPAPVPNFPPPPNQGALAQA